MVVIVMGVTGCGKTTVGTRLAALASCPVLVIPPRHPVPRRAAFDRIEPDVATEHGPMI